MARRKNYDKRRRAAAHRLTVYLHKLESNPNYPYPNYSNRDYEIKRVTRELSVLKTRLEL